MFAYKHFLVWNYMKDFDIRAFYKESKAREENSFSQKTGMSIRHSFQQYNAGADNEVVFALKTISKRECFGIEFHGSISYMLPINHEEVLLFIFDGSLMSVINELSNWSEPRLDVYSKHTPSLTDAMMNAVQGELYDFCVFVDEEMLCFAKQIEYPLFDKINEGYIVDPEIMGEILSLVQYRNQCVEEIFSFNGFTSVEEKKIALKEGFSFVKKGLRYMRFIDFMSTD